MFSIIIPTYNSSKTLATTLDSIAFQTYANYEVVIVDGESKDGTIELVKQYATKCNISFISEKDKGIYDAMNKGIALAKNEWLYFLGSDDYLYSNTVLEKVAQTINNNNCDIVYGNVFIEHHNKVFGGVFDDERMCVENICHQSIFYKKSLLQELGCYNITMKVNADIYLNKILFANKKYSWLFIDETIAFYTSTGFSSSQFDDVYWNQAEQFLKKTFGSLVSKKIIYKSMLPVIKYKFTSKSFGLSLRASWAYKSLYPLFVWLKHPLSYPKLMLKYKLTSTSKKNA